MSIDYSGEFADFYELTWAGYAAQAAPQIRWLFSKLPVRLANRRILDLGCGSGDLVNYLLGFGDCEVLGIDHSADMIALASRRNAGFVEMGRARFVQGDLREFQLDQDFGVVTATYAVLNHFEEMDTLEAIFRRSYDHLDDQGVLYFDLFTRAIRESIEEGWSLDEPLNKFQDFYYLQRGSWIEGSPARVVISVNGFRAQQPDCYRRFRGSISMVVHPIQVVEQALAKAGFRIIACLDADNLTRILDDPEEVDHVAVVAGKSVLSFGFPGSMERSERLMLAPRTDVTFLNGLLRISAPGSDRFVETSNLDLLPFLARFATPRSPREEIAQAAHLPAEEMAAFVERLEQAGALVSGEELVGRPIRADG
ncbi:MAG: class I SAM-dependent methyltransferase [Bradymonadales bacterium]|nr:class I SAM-dependent methyltransferase [Bradymonadales bacterium]